MSSTIRGTIERVFHRSPGFSAGLLLADGGRHVRFAGSLCANAGDVVALVGRWEKDRKFGPQFRVESLSYDLPDSADGLVSYLAQHPAFSGIGEKTARRIVDHAGDRRRLDHIIRTDVNALHRALRIPVKTLGSLRAAWIANAADNEVRTYLASFGLTAFQIDSLLQRFGHGIVGILRSDPFELIHYVPGYGFKRVDKIARAIGVRKDHPGRLEAGLRYLVQEEIQGGHTFIDGPTLLERANELLILDSMDSQALIRAAGERLLQRGVLVAEGSAVTTPSLLEAERLIRQTLAGHGWSERAVTGSRVVDDLNEGQRDALRLALLQPVTLISGAAGTGKTYVLARITRVLLDAGLQVALCSPTGKASKRIEETMRGAGIDLAAKTIHRLLRYDGHTFHRASLSHDEEDGDTDMAGPEPADGCDTAPCEPGSEAVIIDEVSMVDVPLMAAVISRIDFEKTRLILVGDHNQLPPVGPGNVLRDLVQHRIVPTVVLDRVERQAGVLKTNSTAVLQGIVAPSAPNDPQWTVIDSFDDVLSIQAYVRDLVLTILPRHLGLDAIRDVQIITPTHLGALGTKAINKMMQHALHGSCDRKFAVGDKVMQTANDYELGVMNGTQGRVVAYQPGADGGYRIAFDGVGVRQVRGEKLHRVMLSYAVTAHKAQGSEFRCAVVLCHRSHYFADRNWLYTAVTRASKYCMLIGDRWGLRHAARKNTVITRRTFIDRWCTEQRDSSTVVREEDSRAACAV